MRDALFLANKIKRQIIRNGGTYKFHQVGIDEFKQPNKITGEYELKGLFHIIRTFISPKESDASRTTSKPQPMIMCIYVDGLQVSKDDLVSIGGSNYKVIAKDDKNDLNIIFDISLELINVG